jgi:hypothetical protein
MAWNPRQPTTGCPRSHRAHKFFLYYITSKFYDLAPLYVRWQPCMAMTVGNVFANGRQSNYFIEERWGARVLVHEGQHTGQTMIELKTVFQQRFGKPSLPTASLLSYEILVVSLGQVKDPPRRGRSISRTVTCPAVVARVEQLPHRAKR